jgi:dipeptidyl aminopeptidase/acylaminoacyl peptidase
LIAFVREDATHPEDIWLTDADFSEPRQVTVTNPHVQDVAFSAPQLMDWVGPDGIGYRCAFFPPPDRCGPPPYPTIFLAYDGRISGSYSAFGFQGPHCDNIQVFTSHGYAVCGTDVVVSDESPAKSIRELLNAAVKAVVAQGLADPKRLGIIGNSYGGYIVNVALTGLECFAAAVSDTGMANLSSAYGLTTPEGEAAYIGWLESAGLGRMDAPPWEKPERYVENSPIFSLDHVTTPVLIIHGSADPAIPQAWELFSGLCRLGKIAELVVYEGEGHWQGEWRRANVIDRWQRVLGWFDKYLGPERDA